MNLEKLTTKGRALSVDDACPLCLARYALEDEQMCSSCEAHSCPDCAEVVATGEVICFACQPTKH